MANSVPLKSCANSLLKKPVMKQIVYIMVSVSMTIWPIAERVIKLLRDY